MITPALYPIVANGNSYDDTDMENLGYATNLPAAINDILTQILLSYCGTSASSVTVSAAGTTISLTANSGLGFVANMSVAISAAASPSDNYMTGQVIAYNKSTGFMQFEVQFTKGAGTYSSWYVVPVGIDVNSELNDADYGIQNSILGTDHGGTGAALGLSNVNDQYADGASRWLGLGDPSACMVEIFDDLVTGNLLSSVVHFNINPLADIAPPWAYKNASNINGFDATTQRGFRVPSPTPFIEGTAANGILSYGNNGGWVQTGKGAIVCEFLVDLQFCTIGFPKSWGLAAVGAAIPQAHVFGNGGIGFSINSSGYMECFAGSAGAITTVLTGITFGPNTIDVGGLANSFRTRLEIDHSGLTVDFYVLNLLENIERQVASISLSSRSGSKSLPLLIPILEAKSWALSGTPLSTSHLVLRAFYFAKYLMR